MHLLGDFGGIQRDLMAHSNEMKKDSSSETHCSTIYGGTPCEYNMGGKGDDRLHLASLLPVRPQY